jgi:hypothetical protein
LYASPLSHMCYILDLITIKIFRVQVRNLGSSSLCSLLQPPATVKIPLKSQNTLSFSVYAGLVMNHHSCQDIDDIFTRAEDEQLEFISFLCLPIETK